MKPHPRIRKTIKWGGAALTVLLVVVWTLSNVVGFSWCGSSGTYVRIARGRCQIEIVHDEVIREDLVEQSLLHSPDAVDPVLLWTSSTANAVTDIVRFNFWRPTMLAAAVCLTAFRLDTLARRRARMNLCPKCHYDRTGLAVNAVCPECGTGSGTA